MLNWKSDRKVQFLRDLVEINSGTHNVTGVNAVQDVVAAHIKKMGLSFTFESHPVDLNSAGKVLISEIKFSDVREKAFINLVTHADTVFEPESGFLDFKLNEAQGIATGPGVIDDKGGIVVALSGLERFLKKSKYRANIRFICTPTEETGSPGFHELLKKLGDDSWMILGFEPSLEDGSIVCSRRGNRWYHFEVSGHEAHAGRDFQKGVNAAHELAFKIAELHQLNDLAKDVTLSIGQISGGSKFNIVCGHAEAKLDVRFSDFKMRDQIHHQIETIFKKNHIGPNVDGILPSCSYKVADDCPPFSLSPDSSKYHQVYLDLIQKIEGKQVSAVKAGGAADANYMSRDGLMIMDGLGATGGGMHRKDEFIRLESLDTRAECLAQFLEYTAQMKNNKK